jgi:uncharacterized protein with beta-barrel porin domain
MNFELMKPVRFFLFFGAAIAAWSSPSFAQQQAIGTNTTLTPTSTAIQQGAALTGQVTLIVPDGYNIYTNNSLNGNVVNSTLNAISQTTTNDDGIISFQGSSTVFGTIGAAGTALYSVTGGAAGSTVDLMGNVYLSAAIPGTTGVNVNGTGTVNFDSGSTNTTVINFGGNGTVGLAANTTVNGAVTTNTDNTGTLDLAGGSVLNGAVGGPGTTLGLKAIDVVGGSNTAGISASITGAVSAYTFSLGTNTLNVGGALTIADNSGVGGVINTTLASTSVFGHIIPVGAATIGSALTVNVLVPSTAYFPVGTEFDIVKATSGTNGSIVTVTTQDPTNPLYKFAAVPLSGTTAGLVEIQTTGIPVLVPIQPPPGVPLPPVLPIAAPVVPVLLAGTPPVDVLAPIDALTTPGAVVNAVAQLAPSTPDLAAHLVTFQGIQQFENLWSSRLDEVLCGGQASRPDHRTSDRPNEQAPVCQTDEARSGWWLKGFGYFGSQGSQGAYPGYNSVIAGTMIGYDRLIDAETSVGLGLGYARSTIKESTFQDASTDSNTYQATAYIGHEHGPWYVNGDVSFGWNDYTGIRNISFPGFDRAAQAGYSGQDYTGFVTTGYHFFTPGLTITPLASLQYTHMNIAGYTETGAGDVNLQIKSQSYDFVESGLGVKVAHPFSYRDTPFVPEAHFKWFHDFSDTSFTNTATFAGAGSPSFTTPGLRMAADTFNVGAGLTLLSCSCSAKIWSIEAVYDHYWRSDNYSGNQVMVKFASRF